MNRKSFITLSIVLAVAASLLTVIGQTQRSENSQASNAGAAQSRVDDKPDTRRDVLIAADRAPKAPALAEGAWINSQPLSLENLRGRVVLVDFWTFGCYNCRNTLPTLKAFDERYRNKGLTIVGVHSPESDYEKNVVNLRKSVQRLGIRYPVVTDNDYKTWNAYNVGAWPTVIILDKQGRIRFTHIGEGMYEEQERVIKKLLAE
jgi:thiol-disulfide isomerase/thioredoxin